MRILVTNDDGIQAEGIRHLTSALASVSEVFVFAPDSQRSACGHGITVTVPITVSEYDLPGATRAWSVSGTPADCVKLGLRILKDMDIYVDYVFSGINHGSNLGTDTLYSGTVSGAIEGVINGIPSFAVSVNSRNPAHFQTACEIALRAFKTAAGKLDGKTVLNINLPDVSMDELKGVRVTRLGAREYDEDFRIHEKQKGSASYLYSGEPVVYSGLPDDIDVIAVQDGYASITPLHYDLTNHQLVEEVRSWGF
ncbi:MAG: 5'/3'-nucleotidase SurE [Anaerovoracaceae bacterium]